MSTADVSSEAGRVSRAQGIDMMLEVILVPVSDLERATEFYLRLGWRRDDNTPPGVEQFTPPGSGCSVVFGEGLTSAAPGSAGGFLVVPDIEAAREALVADGIEVGEIFHVTPDGPVPGRDPDGGSYVTRAFFSDPDGNSWMLQEITTRLPGRLG
ncbi:VOC family protein [Streptomyces sp. NBC_01167]|uniref:VOC family protein n=1 Tax=Streptomyces sp. NBC_01167 TaxID=2903756 RepID=UPI00386A71E7|nr:VOC family protein [Streptomyces sp. NBC_01167]